jgi:hypothetical protein
LKKLEAGLNMAAFCVVAPFNLRMTEAESTSETSVNLCQTTWLNNPKDSHLQAYVKFSRLKTGGLVTKIV